MNDLVHTNEGICSFFDTPCITTEHFINTIYNAESAENILMMTIYVSRSHYCTFTVCQFDNCSFHVENKKATAVHKVSKRTVADIDKVCKRSNIPCIRAFVLRVLFLGHTVEMKS